MQKNFFGQKNTRGLFFFSLVISCCVSFCVIYYLQVFLNEYQLNPSSQEPMISLYLFLKNSYLAKAGIFIFLAAVLAISSTYLLGIHFFKAIIQRKDRWIYIFCFIVAGLFSWLIVKNSDVFTLPGWNQIEIIPQSGRVSLLEMKIDGTAVDFDLIEKGEGWIEQEQMLVHTNAGNESLKYRYQNKTDIPIELLFLEGQEAGDVTIKINHHTSGEYELFNDIEGDYLIETEYRPFFAIAIFYLIHVIAIFSILTWVCGGLVLIVQNLKYVRRNKYILPILSVILAGYYFYKLEFSVVEVLRFIVGAIVLYTPMIILFNQLLRKQIKQFSIRIIFSAIASYTLNTLFFFGFSAIHIQILYFIGHVILICYLLALLYKKERTRLNSCRFHDRLKTIIATVLGFDWFLIFLVLLSLVVTTPIMQAFTYTESGGSGEYNFNLYPDLAGQIGSAAELNRHIPPLQNVWHAGTPQRAYHFFNGVTMVLLHRFTGQMDWLRVGAIYLNSILEILLCLSIYAIVYTITNSKAAGYLGLAFVYILAAKWPPLLTEYVNKEVWRPDELYFTLFPYISSTEGLFVSSSQAISGLIPSMGVILGVLLISINLYRKEKAGAIVLTTAFIVASLLRFRLHYFIPLMPGFMIIAFFAWVKSRDRNYLFAMAICIVVTGLLYVEMASPEYLQGSSSLSLTTFYDPIPLLFSAPFMQGAEKTIISVLGATQFSHILFVYVSLFCFQIFNYIGLPVVLSTAFFLFTRAARQEYVLFSFLILWSFLVAIVGTPLIHSEYDHYSIGGQLPWSTQFYLFPLGAWGIWYLYRKIVNKYPISKQTIHCISLCAIIILFFWRQNTFPGKIFENYKKDIPVSSDLMETLVYIREELPEDAVLLKNYFAPFVYPAITGRAVYYDSQDGDLELLMNKQASKRREEINQLWAVENKDEFCARLEMMKPSTYLIYDENISPKINWLSDPNDSPHCLELSYTSSHSTVRLYEIHYDE